MIALIKDGECIAIVENTDGHDLTGVTVVDAPEHPEEWRYVEGEWVERQQTRPEQDEAMLAADSRWNALREATPAQIESWLNANVTNLSEARQVLKLLILAARKLEARSIR